MVSQGQHKPCSAKARWPLGRDLITLLSGQEQRSTVFGVCEIDVSLVSQQKLHHLLVATATSKHQPSSSRALALSRPICSEPSVWRVLARGRSGKQCRRPRHFRLGRVHSGCGSASLRSPAVATVPPTFSWLGPPEVIGRGERSDPVADG